MANPPLGYESWTNLLAMARAKIRPAAGEVSDAQLVAEMQNAIREILADSRGLPFRAYLKPTFMDNVRPGELFTWSLENSLFGGEVLGATTSLYALNSDAAINLGSIEAISLGLASGVCQVTFLPGAGAWCVTEINATYADTVWTVTVSEVAGAPEGVVDRVFGGEKTAEVLVASDLSASELYPVGNPRPYLKQVFTLPSSFEKMGAVYYDWDYKLLAERNWDDLIDGNLTGTPIFYAVRDDQMILYPWPADCRPVCVDFGGVADIDGASVTTFPTYEVPQFLFAGITYQVASRVMSSFGEYRLARVWEARYRRIRSSMIQWLSNQNPAPTEYYQRSDVRVGT